MSDREVWPVSSVRDREDGRCRFNCRTAKENWTDGYKQALTDRTMISPRYHQEIADNEWKRKRTASSESR